MKVLVACEFSGIVREAFKAKGHDAWSCDLLPTEIPGQHIQGDVLEIINNGWDMMIAHPPCTYLSYVGMRNWYDEGRAMKRIKAAEFFMKMYDAPIKHICVENPRGIMSKIFREPDMVIHPYYFGEREMKRTNLWLKNLPVLEYRLEDNLFGIKTATDKPEPVNVQLRKATSRIKKRYLLIEAKNKETVEKAILDYIGILGWAKASPVFVQTNPRIILSVERKSVIDVRAAMELSESKIKVLRVSGTLKGLGK